MSECIPYEIEEKVDTYMYTLTCSAVFILSQDASETNS